MEKPKIGSLVRLKSGGPTLTVAAPTRTDEFVDVEWFAGDDLRRDALHPDCLIECNPSRVLWPKDYDDRIASSGEWIA